MASTRVLSSSVWGAADQAVLSAFSLLLGLAFIKLAPKTEYASYALLMTVLLLAQSLQNALVNSPLTTLLPARALQSEKASIMAVALRLQGWLVIGMVLAGVVAGLFALVTGHDWWPQIASMVAAGIGVLAREFARARYFLGGRPARAFWSDLIYVLLCGVGVAVLVEVGHLGVAPVLGCIGAAGVATGAVAGLRMPSPLARLSDADRSSLQAIFGCARWALPSVVNSWLYANAFLFIVAALMTKNDVADLSASRLLLVPLSFLVAGWSNAFRPRASLWYFEGQAERIHSIAMRSAAALTGVMVAYGVALYAAMPFLQAHLLGKNYMGLGWLMFGWLIFFAIGAVRNVGMCSMLSSPRAFRDLFFYGVLALLVSVPGVVLACLEHSAPGVLAALSLTELALAGAIWFHGWPRLRRAVPLQV